MSTPWAAQIDDDAVPHLGRLRLATDLHAATDEHGQVWLRGPDIAQPVYQDVRRIPGARRYTLDDANRLIPMGRRLPTAVLPKLDWRPIREFISCQPPEAQYAPPAAVKLDLRLVRGAAGERPANVLLTDRQSFLAWVESAPAFRLQGVRFAADAEGQILIVSKHLPPIRGQRFVMQDDVALPAGWRWEPRVPNSIVRQVLRLKPGEIAIAQADAVQRLRRDDLQPLSRSAARLTCQPTGAAG